MNIDDCFSQGLLKRVRPSADKARKSLALAEDTLLKAKDNFRMAHHDIAIVLCYTAMFHAARSILFRDGIKERSHVCMVLYLRHKYPDLGKYVNTLDSYRRSRHTTLYGLDIIVKETDANIALELGKDFISKMKSLIAR